MAYNTPSSGDVVIGPDGDTAYYKGRLIAYGDTEDELLKSLRDWMDREQYWPDVWYEQGDGSGRCDLIDPSTGDYLDDSVTDDDEDDEEEDEDEDVEEVESQQVGRTRVKLEPAKIRDLVQELHGFRRTVQQMAKELNAKLRGIRPVYTSAAVGWLRSLPELMDDEDEGVMGTIMDLEELV